MEKRFKLTVEDVLNKQFNIDFKGYSSVEVDEFLDCVISDYQEYVTMINTLGDRLQEYEKQVTTLKAKIVEVEGKASASANETHQQPGNLDILKRLTRLENEVFKK
ncbi:MAG: DivIVA domain-containing protein [Longicatena sp.]